MPSVVPQPPSAPAARAGRGSGLSRAATGGGHRRASGRAVLVRWPRLALHLAGWQRTLWIAAATQLVTLVGFGLGIPFLPLYVQALGVHERAEVALWSGVLAGAAAFPMAVMSPVWGMLADRFGRKPMLVRSMLGGGVLIAAMGFVTDVWQLLGLRLAQGALTGSTAAAAALVAAATPARQAGFALGVISTSVQVGNSIGPAVGGVTVGALGFRGSFVLGAALMSLAGLLALVIEEPPPAPRPAAADGGWARRLVVPLGWPRFRGLLPLQVGSQFAFSAASGLLPIYLADMARPPWLSPELGAGLAITLTAVAAALSMPFLGSWTDRRGPYGLLVVSMLGTGAVLGLQALLPNAVLFLVLRGVLGVFLAGVTVTLSVLTKRSAPRGSEGAAYGAAASAQALGWGLGPILGAGVAAVAGIPTLYGVAGAGMLGLAFWARRVRV